MLKRVTDNISLVLILFVILAFSFGYQAYYYLEPQSYELTKPGSERPPSPADAQYANDPDVPAMAEEDIVPPEDVQPTNVTLSYGPAGSPTTPKDDYERNPAQVPDAFLDHLELPDAPEEVVIPDPTEETEDEAGGEAVEPETQPETLPETQPEAQPETQPEAQPETQPEAQPETQPEAQPETQPEAQPEAQPEVQPGTQLEGLPETQPETLPESQPGPLPAALADQELPPEIQPADAPVEPGSIIGPPAGSWGKPTEITSEPSSKIVRRHVDDSFDIDELITSKFANRVIVSPKLRTMYCYLPKVACSNWKGLFRKFEGFPNYKDLALAHDRTASGLSYLKDFAPDQVKMMLTDDRWLKFVVVRDPFTRLASAYLDKFSSRDPQSDSFKLFFDQLVGYAWRKEGKEPFMPTFEQFVDYVSEQNPDFMNEHWAPQSDLCNLDSFPYDYVARFEHLDADARLLLDAMGQTQEHFPSQDDLNFLPTRASDKAFEMYDKDHATKVVTKFGRDFKLLDYSTECPCENA